MIRTLRAGRSLGLAVAFLVVPHIAAAQGDSTHLVTSHDAWLAAGFAAATVAAFPIDHLVAHNLQLPQNQNEPGLVRAATVFRDLADPGTVYLSTGLLGLGLVSRNPTLTDIGLHTTESLVLASTVGFVLKGIVGRPLPRQNIADPDGSKFGRGIRVDGNWQAFPSGHTLAAFAVASAITAEAYDRWPSRAAMIGVLTYSAASAAGISRLYNNAHWVSDVIFGAGLGILSGRIVVRYEHFHQNNWANVVLRHAVITPQPHHALLLGAHFTLPAGW